MNVYQATSDKPDVQQRIYVVLTRALSKDTDPCILLGDFNASIKGGRYRYVKSRRTSIHQLQKLKLNRSWQGRSRETLAQAQWQTKHAYFVTWSNITDPSVWVSGPGGVRWCRQWSESCAAVQTISRTRWDACTDCQGAEGAWGTIMTWYIEVLPET